VIPWAALRAFAEWLFDILVDRKVNQGLESSRFRDSLALGRQGASRDNVVEIY
jgi:hypothetical protein